MLCRFQLGQQIDDDILDIADDRHIDLDAFGNRGRIDIDMDNLARRIAGIEMARVADDPIIEARANGNQHIAVLHRHIGFDRAMHAKHAQKLAIRGGIGTEAHQGVGTGIAQKAYELGHQARSIA